MLRAHCETNLSIKVKVTSNPVIKSKRKFRIILLDTQLELKLKSGWQKWVFPVNIGRKAPTAKSQPMYFVFESLRSLTAENRQSNPVFTPMLDCRGSARRWWKLTELRMHWPDEYFDQSIFLWMHFAVQSTFCPASHKLLTYPGGLIRNISESSWILENGLWLCCKDFSAATYWGMPTFRVLPFSSNVCTKNREFHCG